MYKEEVDRILAGLDVYVKESTSSKEKARQVLVDAGLITEGGEPVLLYSEDVKPPVT